MNRLRQIRDNLLKADEVGDKLRREAGEGFTDFNKEEDVQVEVKEKGKRVVRKMTEEQLRRIEENKKKLKERNKAKEGRAKQADENKEKNVKSLQKQESNNQENQPERSSEQAVNLFCIT